MDGSGARRRDGHEPDLSGDAAAAYLLRDPRLAGSRQTAAGRAVRRAAALLADEYRAGARCPGATGDSWLAGGVGGDRRRGPPGEAWHDAELIRREDARGTAGTTVTAG